MICRCYATLRDNPVEYICLSFFSVSFLFWTVSDKSEKPGRWDFHGLITQRQTALPISTQWTSPNKSQKCLINYLKTLAIKHFNISSISRHTAVHFYEFHSTVSKSTPSHKRENYAGIINLLHKKTGLHSYLRLHPLKPCKSLYWERNCSCQLFFFTEHTLHLG